MIEMTQELAERAAKAALTKGRDFHKPFTVSVVDESGRLVYLARGDGAGFYTADTSRAKAMAAASFRRSTLDINDHRDANPLLWFSLSGVIPGDALPSPGGLPLRRGERVIGAIGIGGGLPHEDHQCALAAQESFDNLQAPAQIPAQTPA